MIKQTVFGFKVERTGEDLTAHGGLALMAEFNDRLGLKVLTDQYLPGPGSNRGYAPSVFVESVVLMLQGGGQCLEDVRELKRESGLMRLMGCERIPDPDSVGDWLRRMGGVESGQAGLGGLGKVQDLINVRILEGDGISEYTLDADAMQIEGEKDEAQWTYQKVRGYMPMLGFLYETPVCIYEEFREGNVPPQAEQLAFYRACQARMPKGKRIARYRADSASYQADLINGLEEDRVIWAITADQDRAVKGVIRAIPEGDWRAPVVGCGYEVAETVHTMGGTKRAFRLIVKRWLKPGLDLFEEGRYAYHAVGSNWPEEEKDTEAVLEWHNQRGEAENFNKALKRGFGLDRMPCGQFGANAVFFRIGAIAYNLFIGFKRRVCPQSLWSKTVETVRWTLIQVAGRIVRHAGRTILRLVMDHPTWGLFCDIWRKCFELSFST